MVTAVSINPKPTKTKPTPLSPSESDNALTPRKPKLHHVTSRYMFSSSCSPSSSSSSNLRRCQSPLQSTAVNLPSMGTTTHSPSQAKRSLSVIRTRPANPRLKPPPYIGAGSVTPSAQKMLFTSTRSLSVSFQGESFSIQVSKEKPTPSPNLRKITPEGRKATTPGRVRNGNSGHVENSRSNDQQRWPGTMRTLNCTEETKKLGGSRDVRNSLDDEGKKIGEVKVLGSELISSDNETEKFWQEANYRLGQNSDPTSPSSNRTIIQAKHSVSPKDSCVNVESPIISNIKNGTSKGQVCVSPVRTAARSASPYKVSTSASCWRGMSPCRVRSGQSERVGNVPSILSFVVDVRRGKIGESRIVDAHLLRLLYNKLLQWRFVNATADSTLSVQKSNAEKSIYDAWVATSKLRESVRAKKAELMLLKQHIKLISILKEQMTYLEDWALLDRGYSSSLSGAIEALKASTLRLPVVSGAKADVLNVKDAICSAVDVMQAMASSICLLSPKVGHVNSLLFEASNLSSKELALLEECKNLLSIISALQISEKSLKTHILQLKCLPYPETKQ